MGMGYISYLWYIGKYECWMNDMEHVNVDPQGGSSYGSEGLIECSL